MALTQVKSDGIATGAVTATQIAANAVTVDDIANGSISTAKLADANVTTAKLADDAVTADKLADTAVTAGTYGSSSAIPSITVDAQGRITSASTSSIDSTAITNGTSNVSVAASGDITATRAGTQRLAVTSTGINVTGTVTCDGLTSDGQITAGVTSGAALVIKDTDSTGSGSVVYLEGQASNGSQAWYFGQNSSANNTIRLVNNSSAGIEFGTNAGVKAVIESSGHFRPDANGTFDCGTSSYRWRNVYTSDLNLSNEGSSNDVDGTWGSWTIQEGEDDLFLINGRNGKKYKFNLTEVN